MSERKNNTTISFRDFISIAEGKQVGTIYHFTKQQSFLDMIDKDFELKSNFEYISFTRNHNMMNYEHNKNTLSQDWQYSGGSGVRISIDGNKLSNKYKIEPYLDISNDVTRKHGENEERIQKTTVSISCCIIQVDVIGSEKAFEFIQNKLKEYNPNINTKHVTKTSQLKKVK